MRFARDDARLDFVTHSEHDIWLDAGEWELMREKSAEYDEPGRFVPYLGWEWTRHTRQGGGHHNVLYRTVGDQDVISVLEFPTLSELYRELDTRYDRRDVVVIPHAHNPGDFRQSHPGLEPLVEMMSMHGTFEWFMQEYLSRGHQVGVVAASDDHLSHPGYSAPNRTSLAQSGGLGAVFAPEMSRDAIFDAMKARRTYATTGDRIILDFKVNDTMMGSRAPFSDVREIAGRVIGTAPIGSIALIKNEEELWSEDYSLDTAGGAPADLLLTFYSEETPVHMGDAPRGWRHWRGRLTVAGAPRCGPSRARISSIRRPSTWSRAATAPSSGRTPAARRVRSDCQWRTCSPGRRSCSNWRRRPKPVRRRRSTGRGRSSRAPACGCRSRSCEAADSRNCCRSRTTTATP